MHKPKVQNKTKRHIPGDIMNLTMLLVVISGVYAVYVVVAGTQGIEPKIMVAPLAGWLALKLIHQFTK